MTSRLLATFSGKYGDILWSLPTVRALWQLHGEKLDFACMPGYRSLLPLIQAQPYVAEAFVLEDWQCLHSNHGDQPWHPPMYIEQKYERFWHLGYRGHPGMNGNPNHSLMDYIADQQGMKFVEPPVPFLTSYGDEEKVAIPLTSIHGAVPSADNPSPYLTMGFNDQYVDLKAAFRNRLLELLPEMTIIDVTQMTWLGAATIIKNSFGFVGCRSSLAVVAHGVGQKVITYEPHPARHQSGMFGHVFGCPWGTEVPIPLGVPPMAAAQAAVQTIEQWRNDHENATAVAG